MKFKFIPYFIPLFLSFLSLLTLAAYAYRHRSVRGSKAFGVCMLIGSLWALSNALEMSGIDLNTKLFWANIQYIAYTFAPVGWLVMVLQFTDRAALVNKKNLILLSIIPVVTVILVWTDNQFGLVRYGFSLDSSGAFPTIAKSYGLWFWVHFTYSYSLNFLTIVFLFRTVLQKNTVYRRQAFHLMIGFSIVSLCNLLYVSGLSPFAGFDITPISFSIAGIIIGRGTFRFRLFDLVPIARETVIEKMGSGIIVLDKMNRIIDINPRAGKMLGMIDREFLGQSLQSISPELQRLIPANEEDNLTGGKNKLLSEENNLTQKEFIVEDENGENRYYELYLSLLRDHRGDQSAWVLILNDITDLKMAREQVNLQKQELAVMDERERMARDLHDNLGQILSFSNIQIPAVRQELKKGNYQLADQYLQRLNEIIKDAHKEIREYVYNIRDNSYAKKDLASLLKEEIADFRGNSPLKVAVEIDEISLAIKGTEEKLQLLHILKESLTNILKYAEADTVRIALNQQGEEAVLIIEDNGKGISNSISIGSGLSIMNERARLVGGKLKIESQPGRGTKVIVRLPVRQ